MTTLAHEVYVACNCADIERCKMELYVSDVRLLERELARLLQRLKALGELTLGS